MRMIFALAIVFSLAWTAAAPAQEKLNHLSGEGSPYLKRAISQPVGWPLGRCGFSACERAELPHTFRCGGGVVSLVRPDGSRDYTNAATADYINQHFVSVKVDFDASPQLVAQLQRAQAILNLPAGLPLTSFITPDGKLYFGAGYLPSEHKGDKSSFREAADEALARYAEQSKIDEESFQLKVER
jgi:uncharacterized protein YyaL (SSP411 family)